MPEGPAKARAAALVMAGCSVSVFLLLLLFWNLPFDATTYKAALARARWSGLAGILLSTVFHCWISGEKWRYVTRLTNRSTDLGAGYYLYSALIGLLGQLLPLQVAMVTGRSFALRLHGRVPLRHGAGGTIYDQCFDLLVPASLILPTMLAAMSVLSLNAAGLLAVLCLAGAGVLVACSGEKAFALILKPVLALAPARSRSRHFPGIQEKGRTLVGRRPLATLYLLSVIRFANLAFRGWLVAWTLHIPLSWLAVLFSSCGVTFSLVFAFAPGALGVVEWGWIGMLHLFGTTGTDAAQFAISSRLFTLVALITLNILHAAILVAYWGLRVRRSNAKPAM